MTSKRYEQKTVDILNTTLKLVVLPINQKDY